MADREIKLDLLATDKTGPATKRAADNLDDVADAADRASESNETLSDRTDETAKSTDGLGDSTEETSRKTDNLGKSQDSTADRVAKLGREIETTKGHLTKLHEEFASTDDEAGRIDLSRQIRKTEQDIKRLGRSKSFLSKLLPEPAEVAREAEKVGGGIISGITGSFRSAATQVSAASGDILVPAIAAIGITAAPILGASIAGAIIGGAGIGGVVGGALLASKDPRVQAAGTALGATLLNQLEARAGVFVGPVLDSIKTIDQAFAASGDDFSRIFQNSATFVKPLTDGVAAAVQKIVHGVADLTDGAAPVIKVIGEGINRLGDAVGDVFTDLSNNGADAAVALDIVFRVLEGTIRLVGSAVNFLAETFGNLAELGAFGEHIQRQYIEMKVGAEQAATATDEVTTSLGDLKGVGSAATGVIKEVSGAVDDLTASNRSLYGSTVDAAEALARATDTIKENGKNLSLNSEKGRENRAALSSVADALSRNYDNYVKVNGAGEGANKVAEKNRASFIRLAEKAGYASGAASDLADELLGIPNVNRTVTVRVKVFGAAAANAALQTARILAGYRAGGGSVEKGKAYVVGEHRAEVFVPKEDGTIVKSIDDYHAQGGGGGSRGGGGGGTVTARVAVDVTGAESRMKAMVREWFNNGDFANYGIAPVR